jgi:hypothetical protein
VSDPVKSHDSKRANPNQNKKTAIMKTMNHKALLAGAAIAGLMTGTTARVHATQTQNSGAQLIQAGVLADDTTTAGKHSCKGANACKGQGGCKAGDNGCKAKNTCKGKGGCATDGSKV